MKRYISVRLQKRIQKKLAKLEAEHLERQQAYEWYNKFWIEHAELREAFFRRIKIERPED